MGTTMYLLLTDVLPFPLLQDRDITDATRFLGPLRSATTYNIHVDAALDAILARCLAKKPSERYSNAMELLTDLSRWRPGQSVGHQPRTITTDTSKDALGSHSLADKAAATTSVREAQRLSREPGKLMVAADILEEALNKDPDLRDRYESQLVLWRRGVVM
jgi:serine/threonine-protein kinase